MHNIETMKCIHGNVAEIRIDLFFSGSISVSQINGKCPFRFRSDVEIEKLKRNNFWKRNADPHKESNAFSSNETKMHLISSATSGKIAN